MADDASQLVARRRAVEKLGLIRVGEAFSAVRGKLRAAGAAVKRKATGGGGGGSKQLRIPGQPEEVTACGGVTLEFDGLPLSEGTAKADSYLNRVVAELEDKTQAEEVPEDKVQTEVISKLIRTGLQSFRHPPAEAPAAGSAQQQPGDALLPLLDRSRSIRVDFLDGKIKPIAIVMLVVGTRGDVQPFIGIALKLKEYGHRVRIATHKVFREFVTSFGLEFYPIGGDPKVLSEFVVKHRGLWPGLDIADAMEQREQVREILYSSWGACVLPDPETPDSPFVADAIVANPPAYGHTHCAEKLNVPLHIVFTMPWTPTTQFPNPFARYAPKIVNFLETASGSKEVHKINWLTYFGIDNFAWLGMASLIKDFRRTVLKLEGFDPKKNGASTIYYSQVPITYIWSPSLVAQPLDWPSYTKVVGFVNLDLKSLTQYQPPQELQDFLDAGPPPCFIGFGSLVVEDPVQLTRSFLEALKVTGLRAIIQQGWGGLGAGVEDKVEDVLFIGAAAHDWLFPRCSAVVHHGGAGTTACGLYSGKPTFIVPFFGDQPFWGMACHKAGVGPAPVPIDLLSTDRIIDALKTLMMPACQRAAASIQGKMLQEDGIAGAVDHLHCSIYGALLGGRACLWMRNGAQRNQVDTSIAAAAQQAGQRKASCLPKSLAELSPRRSGPLGAAAASGGAAAVAWPWQLLLAAVAAAVAIVAASRLFTS